MRNDLYATGITVQYGYARNGKWGWAATLSWKDGKFCQDGTVEGKIETRYFEETLEKAIDAVLEVAHQFGLIENRKHMQPDDFPMYLFYEGDSENRDYPPPPGWKAILCEEAQKRGWQTYKNLTEA